MRDFRQLGSLGASASVAVLQVYTADIWELPKT